MTAKKIIHIFSLLIFSQAVFATTQDSLLFNKVLVQLKIKESEINLELATDKILPYSKDKTVLVIPKYLEIENDGHGNSSFDLDAYIIIANSITGKIIHTFYESSAWTSDAVSISSIEIDTGLYILNKKTRAFGIRVNYSGSSQVNPYSSTDLSLYIVKKNTLKRILENFNISDYRGEWDTRCTGHFEDSTSVISIDKIQSHYLNNLIIKTTLLETTSSPTAIKDDCIEKIKTRISFRKLHYNGTEYK